MAKPKAVTQGKTLNYLGKQPTVSGVPKKWKSSPNHPATELAYITKKEKDVLIDLDLHNSLKGKANKGPGGLPSLNGGGSTAEGRSHPGGFNAPSGPSGPVGRGEGRNRQRSSANMGKHAREAYEYQQAEARRRAAAAKKRAEAAAAKKAAEEAAARRVQQEQQRIAAEQAAARQAAQQAAARQAQEEAARQAAAEAARVAEQQRLAAIEEQRRRDAEEAARQRAAEEARRQAELQRAQALGTVVTTGPMASLNRPADPLPRYRGYTPMDYDVSKTGSLTDQYARMLNVPFFQPFLEQDEIQGPTPQDSIFGIDSLMPTYSFDEATGLASNPFAPPQQATYLQQGGRVGRDMGGIIGLMDEPINIMYPGGQNNVLHGGISSILKKYKEIRSEL